MTRARSRGVLGLRRAFASCVLLLALPATALAQLDAGVPDAQATGGRASSPDGGALDGGPRDAGGHDAEVRDAEVDDAGTAAPRAGERQRELARQIRRLVDGTLDVSVQPSTLFDVALDDEGAIRVEAERLGVLVDGVERRHADAGTDGGVDAGAGDAISTRRRRASRRRDAGPPDAGTDAGPPDAGAANPLPPLDPAVWSARVELDRARLEFYVLPRERRAAILAAHAERQRQAAEVTTTAVELSDAERRVRQADLERRQALEVAQRARTEAGRLVADERVRLLEVGTAQARFDADLVRARQALEQRAERTLGLRRRVREATSGGLPAASVDALYQELRAWLRATRDELPDALAPGDSAVPAAGPDRLGAIAIEIDRSAVDETRATVEETARGLREREAALGRDRVRQLSDEMNVLNADRLALLPHLSPSRRSQITGFGADGLDQAASEVRQVVLVLRSHTSLLASMDDHERGQYATVGGVVLAKWLVVLLLFIGWWRRGVPAVEAWHQRVREQDRRGGVVEPGRLDRALGVLLRVHRPLSGLALLWILTWLLPAEVRHVLEVDLLVTAAAWILGGSLVVLSTNAIVAARNARRGRPVQTATAALRLRSLRLVGRVVVVFGVILALSDRLVGRGTIYQWVFSTCWFATVPILIVIVRWWRPIIFERVQAIRKKTALQRWVVAHPVGLLSPVAALLGGVHLFGAGAVRAARAWIGRFDVTRRVLAYLFRRELDKRADEERVALSRLPEETFAALGPELASAELVASRAGDDRVELVARIDRPGGGVFAIVGERGAGKSTLLRSVHDEGQDVVVVDCPSEGLEALRRSLVESLGLDEGASLIDCAKVLDAPGRDAGLLIDNAHRLIQPVMGGLAEFDRLIEVARHHSSRCAWVFAVDEVIWRFFERARGARPLLDEVIWLHGWREEEIVQLLCARSAQAGLEPSFEHLIDRLPPDADEVDRQEALARAAAGYYRLLWDYSAGNPGVALHMWRRSLGLDADGRVCVRFFEAPNTNDLDLLPDPAVFVLRAVIQLDPARIEDIARATMLGVPQVEDALRYGLARGYVNRHGDRYRIGWGWFRAITRFLRRRHLLPERR